MNRPDQASVRYEETTLCGDRPRLLVPAAVDGLRRHRSVLVRRQVDNGRFERAGLYLREWGFSAPFELSYRS